MGSQRSVQGQLYPSCRGILLDDASNLAIEHAGITACLDSGGRSSLLRTVSILLTAEYHMLAILRE
jgi:hypothetical protein